MADKKISEDNPAGPLTGNEFFPLVQGGANVRVSLNTLFNYIIAAQNSTPLGPTSTSVATNVAAGSTVATITGLNPGETLASISPSDNRLVISGNNILAGSVAFVAGSTTYTITTSSGRALTLALTAAATPVLGALTLSNASFTAGAAPGTVIGVITGKTAGSTLAFLPNDGRVVLDGTNLVVGSTNATAGTISGTLTETLSGATGSPKTTNVSLTVNAVVTLNSLMLDNTSFATSAAAGTTIGNIVGKTSGSTITFTPSDNRVAVSSDSTKLVVGVGTLTAGTITGTLTETLSGAAGSPKTSNVTLTVTTPAAVTVLSPANFVLNLPAGAGSAASAFSNLPTGARITGISPADGRLVTNSAQNNIVVGLNALTLGTYQYDVTVTRSDNSTFTFQYELQVQRSGRFANSVTLAGTQASYDKGPDGGAAVTGYGCLQNAAPGSFVGIAKTLIPVPTYVSGVATVGLISAGISSGGSGYVVGEVITLGAPATTPATLTVSTVNAGAITAVTVTTPGSYTAIPSNPVSPSASSGSGTGAAFNLGFEGFFLSANPNGYFAINQITGQITVNNSANTTPIPVGNRPITVVTRCRGYNDSFVPLQISCKPAYTVFDLSGTLSYSGGTTVSGTGTSFTTQLTANTSYIYYNGESRLVTEIASNTSLKIASAFSASFTNKTVQTNAVINKFLAAPTLVAIGDSIIEFNHKAYSLQGYPNLQKLNGGEINVAQAMNNNFHFRNWFTPSNTQSAGSSPAMFWGSNQGLASDNVVGAKARLNGALALQPDALLLAIGTNNTGPANDPAVVVAGIADIIDTANATRPWMPILVPTLRAFGPLQLPTRSVANYLAINAGINALKANGARPWLIIVDHSAYADNPQARDVQYPTFTVTPANNSSISIAVAGGSTKTITFVTSVTDAANQVLIASGGTAAANLAATLVNLYTFLQNNGASIGVSAISASNTQILFEGLTSAAITVTSPTTPVSGLTGAASGGTITSSGFQRVAAFTTSKSDNFANITNGSDDIHPGGKGANLRGAPPIRAALDTIIDASVPNILVANTNANLLPATGANGTGASAAITPVTSTAYSSISGSLPSGFQNLASTTSAVDLNVVYSSEANDTGVTNAKSTVISISPKTTGPTVSLTNNVTTNGTTSVTGTALTSEVTSGMLLTVNGVTRKVLTVLPTSLTVDYAFPFSGSFSAVRTLAFSGSVGLLLPGLTQANLAVLAGQYFTMAVEVEVDDNPGWQNAAISANFTPTISYTKTSGGVPLQGTLSTLTSSGLTPGSTVTGLNGTNAQLPIGHGLSVGETIQISSTDGIMQPSGFADSYVVQTTPLVNAAGTAAAAQDSNVVNGTGTSFATEFTQGSLITLAGVTKRIITIASAVQLTVDSNFAAAIPSGTQVQRSTQFTVTLANTITATTANVFNSLALVASDTASIYGGNTGTTRRRWINTPAFRAPKVWGVSGVPNSFTAMPLNFTVRFSAANATPGTTAVLKIRQMMLKVVSDPTITAGSNPLPDAASETYGPTLNRTGFVSIFNDNFDTRPVIDNSATPVAGSYRSEYYFSDNVDALPGRTLKYNNEVETYSDLAYNNIDPFRYTRDPLGTTALSIILDVAPNGATGIKPGTTHTSGLLTTQRTFSRSRMYFEVRCIMPFGTGAWPAIWLIPALQTTPYDNTGRLPEIDIFELFGKDPYLWSITTHYGTRAGEEATNFRIALPNDYATNYHTYGIGIDDNWYVYYIDDKEVARISNRVPRGKVYNVPGTLTTTTANPTTVTGVGTSFLNGANNTNVPVNSILTVNGESRTVLAVASNGSLTIDQAFSSPLNAATGAVRQLIIPNAGQKMTRSATDAGGDDPVYPVLNLAATGTDASAAGNINRTQMPLAFKIDYMRAFSGYAAAAA